MKRYKVQTPSGLGVVVSAEFFAVEEDHTLTLWTLEDGEWRKLVASFHPARWVFVREMYDEEEYPPEYSESSGEISFDEKTKRAIGKIAEETMGNLLSSMPCTAPEMGVQDG